MSAAVRAAFARQARACDRLGSPFMARLMALCGERLVPGGTVADAVLGWTGDPGVAADNVPLRLAGGLHRLVLSGAAPGLAACYPPHRVADAVLWAAIADAMADHDRALVADLARAPQTNEVRRAAALAPCLALVARATRRPLALWEIGCAAGLNLRADRFAVRAGAVVYGPAAAGLSLAPDWTGPAPAPVEVAVVARRGVDIAPLDPADTADRLRLLSYLWPDQPARRALTEAACAVAAAHPARIETADAADWLERALPGRPPCVTTVLIHTVAWQYLPGAVAARAEAAIAAAGAAATAESPLARVAMEADGGRMAGLTVTLWPGGAPRAVARVDFHGRAVVWTGPVRLAGAGG